MEITKGKLLSPVKGVFYGPEKVGKTTLAASLQNVLAIDVDGGTSELDVARTPRPTSWTHLLQIVKDIIRDPQGYKVLVLDTADAIERLAITHVCQSLGVPALGGQNDYGHTYGVLIKEWDKFLTMLDVDLVEAGKMHVVFTCHSVTRKFELPDENGQFDKYELSLEKKTGLSLKAWAKMLLFLNYKTIVTVETNNDGKVIKAKGQGGTRRVVYAQHSATIDAGNRYGMPAEFDLSEASKHILPHFADIPTLGLPSPVKSRPVPTQTAPAPVAPVVVPAPIPPVDSATPPVLTGEHAKLDALMRDSGVTWGQVLSVMVARGKAAQGTALENLNVSLIQQWLLPHWDKVVTAIKAA